jgi:3-hydroxybutyrate dehydrogenase
MRRVLVTGGGTGIGRSIAQAFADHGDEVTIAGRRMDALESAAIGRNISCKVVDVTKEPDIEALFDVPFDVVIANAGGGASGKIAKTSLEQWESTLRVNLTGTFLTFRAALAKMGSGGRLISIASTAALKGNASVPAYAAAKHGVLGLVRSIALDVAKSDITCNAICPGFTNTDLADNAITGLLQRFDMCREKATGMIASSNPQERLFDRSEIAATALFLASKQAAGINGHALSVSGGEI